MKIIGLVALVVLSPILYPIAVIGMYRDDARIAEEDRQEYLYNEAQKLNIAEPKHE
jgi:hypothetical protein